MQCRLLAAALWLPDPLDMAWEGREILLFLLPAAQEQHVLCWSVHSFETGNRNQKSGLSYASWFLILIIFLRASSLQPVRGNIMPYTVELWKLHGAIEGEFYFLFKFLSFPFLTPFFNRLIRYLKIMWRYVIIGGYIIIFLVSSWKEKKSNPRQCKGGPGEREWCPTSAGSQSQWDCCWAPPECSSLGQQSAVCCGLELEWAKVTFTAIIPLLLLFHRKWFFSFVQQMRQRKNGGICGMEVIS